MRSYDLGSVDLIIMKFIWLHGFHILVRVIFMIGRTAPCWDQINEIIWVAHLLRKLFEIVSLITISSTSLLLTAGDRNVGNQYPHLSNLHLCGWRQPTLQRFKGHSNWKEGQLGFPHLVWNGVTFQLGAKMTEWILNFIFPSDGVEYWYQD